MSLHNPLIPSIFGVFYAFAFMHHYYFFIGAFRGGHGGGARAPPPPPVSRFFLVVVRVEWVKRVLLVSSKQTSCIASVQSRVIHSWKHCACRTRSRSRSLSRSTPGPAITSAAAPESESSPLSRDFFSVSSTLIGCRACKTRRSCAPTCSIPPELENRFVRRRCSFPLRQTM